MEELSVEDLDALLSINVRSVVLATKEALKFLPDGGRIVNVGSFLADRVAWIGCLRDDEIWIEWIDHSLARISAARCHVSGRPRLQEYDGNKHDP